MKPMFRWYLIGVAVAFGGIFFLVWAAPTIPPFIGITLAKGAGIGFWSLLVYYYLKSREEEAKKKGQGGSP